MKKYFLFNLLLINHLLMAQSIPAFPSAEGFGATTITGGRGGQVIFVTNLNCSGAGSLNEALKMPGFKYILFKVSGVIDCAAEVVEGDCYIAGQTSPGGIVVRNLIFDSWYHPERRPNNVIVRHLSCRPSENTVRPATGWLDGDALRLDGAKNVILDHCNFTHATDENVQISRSSNIIIQNSLLAETMGEHFEHGGMLLNYSVEGKRQDSISIHHNMWNRIGGRMPEISGERSAERPNDKDCMNKPLNIELSYNLFWDMPTHVWFNSGIDPAEPERADYGLNANMIGNYAVGRASYNGGMFHNHFLDVFKNNLYVNNNRMERFLQYADYQLFTCCNDFAEEGNHPNKQTGTALILKEPHPFPTITPTTTDSLKWYMMNQVGTFNRFSEDRRDPLTRRLLSFVSAGKPDGNLVDGTDYYKDVFKFDYITPPLPPLDSDGDGMPDEWEIKYGLDHMTPDHNGMILSIRLTGYGTYSNLECYLNQLADELVKK
ncbi:MAG: hypothetical protein RIS64_1315 [Bacteroidota bacterium]